MANSISRELSDATFTPVQILARATKSDVDIAYSVRLESQGPHLIYVVRPTPYAVEMTFDAMTGARLDPLPDSLPLAIADEHLSGTRAVRRIIDVGEYHRDYDVPFVAAARIAMEGAQTSELILSRASGRPLRRLDGVATGFEAWYRAAHVFQWGGAMGVFTTLLYVVTGAVAVLAILGIDFRDRETKLFPRTEAQRDKRRGQSLRREAQRDAQRLVDVVQLCLA